MVGISCIYEKSTKQKVSRGSVASQGGRPQTPAGVGQRAVKDFSFRDVDHANRGGMRKTPPKDTISSFMASSSPHTIQDMHTISCIPPRGCAQALELVDHTSTNLYYGPCRSLGNRVSRSWIARWSSLRKLSHGRVEVSNAQHLHGTGFSGLLNRY